MGLIKALTSSAKGTLTDQWKEYFVCDSLDNNTLVVKGQKKTNGLFGKKHGTDNIITNGSGVVVADGQCAIIVEKGTVTEVCAEPGEYTFSTTTAPTIFQGSLWSGIVDIFKETAKRFTYAGEAANDQRIYYFNIKELRDNTFGTSNPIPFRVVDKNINLDIDVAIRCNGLYTYRIVNPMAFYKNVCGNITGKFHRNELDAQLKTEFISALQPALAKISELEVRPNAIPGHVEALCDAMNEILDTKWLDTRGIMVETVAMNPVTLTDEDAALIKTAQKAAILKDPNMAAATLAEAQAEAMKTAAGNTAGAMTGFMGMNMSNQFAGGANLQGLYAMGEEQNNECLFCPECGKKVEPNSKFCKYCGHKLK